jgi:DNA modification methylase
MRKKKKTSPRPKTKAATEQQMLRFVDADIFPPGLHEWSGHTTGGVRWEVHRGDVSKTLKSMSADRFQCAVTSPPYFWQRDYRVEGQIGLEPKIDDYVSKIVETMEEVKRVLKSDGVLFLNLGDTYYSAKGMPRGADKKSKARRFGLRAVDASGLGVPRKTALGIPWRVALAMIAKGWVLRAPIVWQRLNSIPEPTAKDRPWRTYELVFLFSKSPRYFFSREALGREEDIWRIPINISASKGVHSAAYPEALVDRCIKCGSREGDEILDPFAGTGTALAAAIRNRRRAVGIDLKDEYCEFMVKQLGAM